MTRGMQVIPTRMHGMLDYLVGALMVASPWIFGFADESSTAKWTFVVLGIVVIATSLMTNYELGAVHAVSMHMHLGADALVGALLAASPWLLGYADDAGRNAWLPALIIGLVEIGTAMMSSPWPSNSKLADNERRMHGRRTASTA
jgi:SPW repeat